MSEIGVLIPGLSAGYVAGQAAEQYALHVINERRSMLPVHDSVDRPQRSRIGNVVMRSVAHLAVMGTLTGLLVAQSIEPTASHESSAAVVAVDIDHSSGVSHDGSFAGINAVAVGMFNSKAVKAKEVLYHNDNGDNVTSTSQITGDVSPLGDAENFSGTVSGSVGAAFSSVAKNSTKSPRPESAVLVLTDNDPITAPSATGNPMPGEQTLVDESKADGNEPLFVDNLSTDPSSNPGVANILRQIARKTGGEYWVGNQNVGNMTKAIDQKIGPTTTPIEQNNDHIEWIMAAVLSGFITLRQFVRRKNETFRKES